MDDVTMTAMFYGGPADGATVVNPDRGEPVRHVRNGRPIVKYLAHITRKRAASA